MFILLDSILKDPVITTKCNHGNIQYKLRSQHFKVGNILTSGALEKAIITVQHIIRTQFKYDLKTYKKCFQMIYTFTVNHTGSKVAIGALPGDAQVAP